MRKIESLNEMVLWKIISAISLSLLLLAIPLHNFFLRPAFALDPGFYDRICFINGELQVFPTDCKDGEYGANASVGIHGRVRYVNECPLGINDFLEAASDIYIARTAADGRLEVGEGTDLRKISTGEPHVATGNDLAGNQFDSYIAFTTPSGSLTLGTYKIILDTCQDGRFDVGQDYVSNEKFTVDYTTAVPSPRIIQIKEDAKNTLVERLATSDKLKEALDNYDRTALNFSGGAGVLGAMIAGTAAVVFVKSSLASAIAGGLIGVAVAGIGYYIAWHYFTQKIEAQKKIDYIQKEILPWRRLANDPPNSDFQRLEVITSSPRILSTNSSDALLASLEEYAQGSSDEAGLLDAFVSSIERFQGAEQAGNALWLVQHSRQAQNLADMIAIQLSRDSKVSRILSDTITSSGWMNAEGLTELKTIQDRVIQSGFNSAEIRDMKNLGLNDTQINILAQNIAWTNLSDQNLRQHLLESLSSSEAQNADLISSYEQYSNDMMQYTSEIIAKNPQVDFSVLPSANSGGPYLYAEGQQIPLNGTASKIADPHSITKYEWDTNGDGKFDDASGPGPMITFNRAFYGFVGLRVTASTGYSSIAYSPIEITNSNSAPLSTTFSPVENLQQMAVGESRTFATSPSDPDSDPISTAWYIDDQIVSSATNQNALVYRPSQTSDIGLHSITANLSDNKVTGGTTSYTWMVKVLGADADSDGWNLNVDCNDNNSLVNPGVSEIVNNGKDDDCDPTTPDIPPPKAAFYTDPRILVANKIVHFIDNSTTAVGTVTQWQWDFDSDGSIDSTLKSPTYNFTSAGAYAVTLSIKDSNGHVSSTVKAVAVLDSELRNPASGILYYTRFGINNSNDRDVKQVTFSYNGTALTLGTRTGIFWAGGRADGIIVAPDGDLLVGVQQNVYKINPITHTGVLRGSGLPAFHLAMDPSNTKFYAMGVPDTPSVFPLNPFANGAGFPLTGADRLITSMAFDPKSGKTFYTASFPNCCGAFGTINMATKVTTRIYNSLSAAHGMVYDPYTGHLMLFGDSQITQIDPATNAIISTYSGFAGYDQGAVDGLGHAFGATGQGNIVFVDYSASGKIGDASNFVATPVLDTNLDDVSPLVGLGAANQPPICQDASITLFEGESQVTTLNCSDTDSTTAPNIEIVSSKVVSGITLTPNSGALSNGQVKIESERGMNGAGGYLIFRAIDSKGGTSGYAIATITVLRANHGPSSGDQTLSTDSDTPLNIALSASDPDNDALTYSIVQWPENGTISGNPPNLVYTPNPIFAGTDVLKFRSKDQSLFSNNATITINVNGKPTAIPQTITMNENSSKSIALTGTDPNDDALSFILTSDPAEGTLTGFNSNTGTLTYTPQSNFYGTDKFRFKVNDGSLQSDESIVTIDIVPSGNAPVAFGSHYWTNQDVPISTSLMGGDAEGDDLTFSIVDSPKSGTLGVLRSPSANGLIANTSATYTPKPGFSGFDIFTFKVNDGTADSKIAAIFVSVNSTAQQPLANDDIASTPEDTPVLVRALLNDTDPNNDPLTIQSVTKPTAGLATINTNGTITYAPDANFNGLDTFNYTINDGNAASNATATVRVTVLPVNDSPSALDDSIETPRNTPISIDVLANDVDPDASDVLRITTASVPTSGRVTVSADAKTILYTPNTGYSGTDSFTYSISDGNGGTDSAKVSINVLFVNHIPSATGGTLTTNEDSAIAFRLNGTDEDGDSLTYVVTQGPTHGSLSATTITTENARTYTPSKDYNGPDSIKFKVNDGTADSNEATISITINPVNDPPVPQNDRYSTNEDTPLAIAASGVLANDTDIDSSSLSAAIVSSVAHGTLSLSGNGGFTYTPAANYNGADGFTYRANDGTANSDSTAIVSLTIRPVNDAPVANSQSIIVPKNAAFSITLTGSDIDAGDVLTFTILTRPSHGTLSGSAPNVVYTPTTNYVGSDAFTFKVNDGKVDSNIATVTIDVRSVTRSSGYWQVHPDYANTIWSQISSSDRVLSKTKNLGDNKNDLNELMGGFWSDISKTTAGKSRTPLDQARMQLIQQLEAAMLNKQAFGSDDKGLISAAKSAYIGTDRAAITDLTKKLTAYNLNGDILPLPVGTNAGNSDSTKAQTLALRTYWDLLP